MKLRLPPSTLVGSVAMCLCLAGCSNDNGDSFERYYEFSFTDNVATAVAGDTVHIVVIQVPTMPPHIQDIPYEATSVAGLMDTVKMKLKVRYGGYSPNPSPAKTVEVRSDSLTLRYHLATLYTKLSRNPVLNESEAAPKLTYYRIESVGIQTSPTKHVTFASRLIRF